MYFLLGISITLAFLLIVNMFAATLASGLWRIISRPILVLPANIRAQIIFALRIGPVAAAIVFVFAFVVPAYLLHEPEESGEVVSGKLALIAIASSFGVCIALYRVFKTWLVTGRLAANWQNNAVDIEVEGVNVPVFRMVHPFPVMAVVGVIRPRIFIAEQVLGSLTADEFQAAVAHEYGHLSSNDNLKRTILRVCRDLVILPVGNSLDRAWAENAESAADEYAANSGRFTALNLASALIKLARIAPKNSGHSTLFASYLIDEQRGDVTSRIRQLLSLSERNGVAEKLLFQAASAPSWLWPAALTALLVLHLTDQRLLLTTHEAIEHFVWLIQ